jgi:hypothetical protein
VRNESDFHGYHIVLLNISGRFKRKYDMKKIRKIWSKKRKKAVSTLRKSENDT